MRKAFVYGGVPVYFHWSTTIMVWGMLAGALKLGLPLIALALSYLAVLLVHESGHAELARRFGYRVIRIEIFPLHGLCHFESPKTAYEEGVIAWGGVVAQLGLLVLAGCALLLFGKLHPTVHVPLLVFTYFNAFVAALNLIPAQGLDGRKAWAVLPSLLGRPSFRSGRQRTQRTRKR